MNLLSKRKNCLVLPEKALPPEWPREWDFPSLNQPPGWPKKHVFTARLVPELKADALKVICLDEFNEPTDELLGQFIQVKAEQRGNVIRCRHEPEALWSKMALLQIQLLEDGNFGFEDSWEFERERMQGEELVVRFSVFGYEGYEVVI